MEKITDKISGLPDGAHYFSLEFFPPKTSMVSKPGSPLRVASSQRTALLTRA